MTKVQPSATGLFLLDPDLYDGRRVFPPLKSATRVYLKGRGDLVGDGLWLTMRKTLRWAQWVPRDCPRMNLFRNKRQKENEVVLVQ
jgi:hypothetical protein